MKVPFVDLRRVHETMPELADLFAQVVSEGSFILGPWVEAFETAWSRYVGVTHVVGVSSGLDALRLALESCGIGAGDRVVTIPSTFIATALAIRAVGATPVFVDVYPSGFGMDLDQLEQHLVSGAKAVIPVHLYGQMEQMDLIESLAVHHGATVIEDACQAHGAAFNGRLAGSLGRAAAFSFYPGKNLGCLGDGGAVTTNDGKLAEKVRLLRNYGSVRKYHHELAGYNMRLDGLQAAVLQHKLKFLDQHNNLRRQVASWYRQLLNGVGDIRIVSRDPSVYHLFVIRTGSRDPLMSSLTADGIQTGIHYPIPIHLQPALADLRHTPGVFPNAESLARECLSLPMFPGITRQEVETVAGSIRRFFHG